MFLIGPKAQLQSMFHPIRLSAAVVYFGSTCFTLFAVCCMRTTRLAQYLTILLSILVQLASRESRFLPTYLKDKAAGAFTKNSQPDMSFSVTDQWCGTVLATSHLAEHSSPIHFAAFHGFKPLHPRCELVNSGHNPSRRK